MRAINVLGVAVWFCWVYFPSTFAQPPSSTKRVLVAEGDSVYRTKQKETPTEHWKLWRLENGDYEVDEDSISRPGVIQIYRFDTHLIPLGFTWKIQNERSTDGKAPTHSFVLSCQYLPEQLKCESESRGHKSEAVESARPPFVMMGEFYGLDFNWFATGVVHLALKYGPKDTTIPVYFLTDGKAVGDIGIEPDQPIMIRLEGEEKDVVFGKEQTVRTFEGGGALRKIRVAENGMVVGITSDRDPASGVGIANYKEYEPWGNRLSGDTGKQR